MSLPGEAYARTHRRFPSIPWRGRRSGSTARRAVLSRAENGSRPLTPAVVHACDAALETGGLRGPWGRAPHHVVVRGPARVGTGAGQTPAIDWIQERYAVTLVYAVVVWRSLVEATPTWTPFAIIGPPESPPAVMPLPRRAQIAEPP